MGLQDYTYRLKAMAGDTAPHDELAVSGDLSGGTITLEDRGGGDWAWQFASGQASVGIPTKTLAPTGTLGGITLALTLRVSNYGTVDFTSFVGVGEDPVASATGAETLFIGRTSANILRARYQTSSTPTAWTQGTTEFTVVLKLETNYSGSSDRASVFYGSSRVDGGSATATAEVVDVFWVSAQNGAVLQIKDAVFWPEELSATDCATLRDSGIRATLDGSGGVTGTLAATEALDTAALAGDVFVTGALAGTDAPDVAAFTGGAGRSGTLAATDAPDTAAILGGTPTITGTMAATEAVDTAAASGAVRWNGIAGDPIKNPSGTLLTGLTIQKVAFVRVSDMAVVLSLTNQVTNGSGLLPVYNSALVNGVSYIRLLSDATGANVGAKTYAAA